MLDLHATDKIWFYALVWGLLLLIALARVGNARRSTVGLPLAFLLSYAFAHCGALVHLVDGYDPALNPYLRGWGYNRDTVADGFEACCLGMIGASIGFALCEPLRRSADAVTKRVSLSLVRKSSGLLLVIGGIAIVATSLFNIDMPGVQATIATVRNLFVVGSCLYIYWEYRTGGKGRALAATAAFSVFTPACLLITTAILADSVAISMYIICFYLTLTETHRKVFLRNCAIISLVTCCIIVASVGYLQTRQVLRSVVWSGGGAVAAFETVTDLAAHFDLETIADNESLALLDGRLNQSIFEGLAIQHLRADPSNFENGATIGLALLAWAPRFLWPGKPERGGSDFVAKHTGLRFSEGTTFGAGPVFELYVNFGYAGVFVGFIVLGFIVRRVDIAAYHALRSGSLGKFAQFQLVGAVLLAPLADVFFLEVLAKFIGREEFPIFLLGGMAGF